MTVQELTTKLQYSLSDWSGECLWSRMQEIAGVGVEAGDRADLLARYARWCLEHDWRFKVSEASWYDSSASDLEVIRQWEAERIAQGDWCYRWFIGDLVVAMDRRANLLGGDSWDPTRHSHFDYIPY